MRKILILAIVLMASMLMAAEPSEKAQQAAFEKFKALEGQWKGKSTRGWAESMSYRTIAGGSVVMSMSFEAHPGETMATMFHPDQGRLMLTHYCVAKNEPRLVASDISDDGNTITFTWLDGTGLKSRDQGHMDKAVYRFLDANRFEAQWTWYQNGQERLDGENRLGAS